MSGGRRCPMLVVMSATPASTRTAPVTVFLAIRHERLRAALWSLLETEPGIEPLAATADTGDLLRLVRRVAPAVAIVDESVLGDQGVARLPQLVAAAPQTAFVVVGMYDQSTYATRAREAGAVDYVCLDDADRLGRSVLEASERSAPFRRRTGNRAVRVVPSPGAESMIRRPPRRSTRSRMPTSPNPPARSDGSKP